MAQDYLQLFRDSAESHYNTGSSPLMALSSMNEGVRFTAVPIEGSETVNDQPQFLVQRTKRIKSEATAQDASVGAGTNFVNRVNKAKRLLWETVKTAAGNKVDFLVRMSRDQDMDVLEGTPYEKAISDGIKNTIIAAEENAEAQVWGSVTAESTKLVVDGTKDAEVVELVSNAFSAIELFVDDFKAYSDSTVALIHPVLAKVFARVQGQSYQTGTNTFPEGAGKGFRYDGRDFFVSPILNTIQGAAATEVAGIIVMDKEAYANAGFQMLLKQIDEKLLDERIVGHSYGELDLVIDDKRIKTFEMTLPTTIAKSKKVND